MLPYMVAQVRTSTSYRRIRYTEYDKQTDKNTIQKISLDFVRFIAAILVLCIVRSLNIYSSQTFPSSVLGGGGIGFSILGIRLFIFSRSSPLGWLNFTGVGLLMALFIISKFLYKLKFHQLNQIDHCRRISDLIPIRFVLYCISDSFASRGCPYR